MLLLSMSTRVPSALMQPQSPRLQRAGAADPENGYRSPSSDVSTAVRAPDHRIPAWEVRHHLWQMSQGICVQEC